jgi:hypothetical protein
MLKFHPTELEEKHFEKIFLTVSFGHQPKGGRSPLISSDINHRQLKERFLLYKSKK